VSDFLFILPSGWTQMSAECVGGSIIGDWLAANDLTSLSDALKARGDIAEDSVLVEARLFNGEVLAVRLG
jgi:hypothetical protein